MRSILTKSALLLALLASQAAAAWTLSGQVVGIVGGDTIKVRDGSHVQHTVRLAGIDAPEKFQAYGQRSKDSLSDLIFRRNVVVEISRKDRSGPRVGKVLLEGRNINLEQIKRGFAWHDKSSAQELTPEERQAFAAAEAGARVQRVGLWRDTKPVPPWEYRQGRRH